MAKPRSEEKRRGVLEAATRVIAAQGLSAATAAIAKEAGVSNGALFVYFATKSDLLNQLYLSLKEEIGAVSTLDLPTDGTAYDQARHMWTRQLQWATAHPDKRQTLVLLGVSDDITPESHRATQRAFAEIRRVLEQSRDGGKLADVSLEFVAALMTAVADTTINFMRDDPANAETYSQEGFEAFWRMVA